MHSSVYAGIDLLAVISCLAHRVTIARDDYGFLAKSLQDYYAFCLSVMWY
jgi:hypothetical protein